MSFFGFSQIITNIVAGILVISFGIIIGNLLGILSKKILHAFEIDRILQNQGMGFPYESFVGSTVQYLIYISGLIMGLTFLGLDVITLYLVLFIILALLIAFILLSLKDFVPNFIAGIIISYTKKVKKGEKLQLDHMEGKVLEVNILDTKMKIHDGDIVLMPNKVILQNKVIKKK
jgi:small conductance mechanosensitive channel